MNTTTHISGLEPRTPHPDEDELVRRAFAAYFRSGDGPLPQPGQDSEVVEINGKHYVVLRNVNGILAVYRVRTSGVLKRLARWPSQLEEW